MIKLNVYGLVGSELQKIENLLAGVQPGPMYQSTTHGLIPIATMNERHRFNAARRMILEQLDDIIADVNQARNLSELQPFVSGLPFSADDLVTLQHLTGIVSVASTTTTPIVQSVAPATKRTLTLTEIFDKVMAESK